ncbi:helix-turn-helix domain-containing protein [Pandoraea terrae]|nr:helix-turn-helix transcriptional regulator [Pandoraea terrae]
MPNKSTDRQLPLLVASLKRLLRAKGIGYREIARTLGVSEPTIKRWLAGQGLTLERLEDLCAFVDVSLVELIEFAAQSADARLRQLSVEQEQALSQERNLAFVFTTILRGWSPEELRREQMLDDATLIACLARLDRLGLIELLPGNNVRLRTVRDVEWRRDGPMRAQFAHWIRTGAESMALQPEVPWGSEMVKVSKASLARLDDMIRDWRRNIRLLGEADRHASADPKAWYWVLISTHAVDLLADGDSTG